MELSLDELFTLKLSLETLLMTLRRIDEQGTTIEDRNNWNVSFRLLGQVEAEIGKRRRIQFENRLEEMGDAQEY